MRSCKGASSFSGPNFAAADLILAWRALISIKRFASSVFDARAGPVRASEMPALDRLADFCGLACGCGARPSSKAVTGISPTLNTFIPSKRWYA